jgi:hypothetical protein
MGDLRWVLPVRGAMAADGRIVPRGQRALEARVRRVAELALKGIVPRVLVPLAWPSGRGNVPAGVPFVLGAVLEPYASAPGPCAFVPTDAIWPERPARRSVRMIGASWETMVARGTRIELEIVLEAPAAQFAAVLLGVWVDPLGRPLGNAWDERKEAAGA